MKVLQKWLELCERALKYEEKVFKEDKENYPQNAEKYYRTGHFYKLILSRRNEMNLVPKACLGDIIMVISEDHTFPRENAFLYYAMNHYSDKYFTHRKQTEIEVFEEEADPELVEAIEKILQSKGC